MGGGDTGGSAPHGGGGRGQWWNIFCAHMPVYVPACVENGGKMPAAKGVPGAIRWKSDGSTTVLPIFPVMSLEESTLLLHQSPNSVDCDLVILLRALHPPSDDGTELPDFINIPFDRS